MNDFYAFCLELPDGMSIYVDNTVVEFTRQNAADRAIVPQSIFNQVTSFCGVYDYMVEYHYLVVDLAPGFKRHYVRLTVLVDDIITDININPPTYVVCDSAGQQVHAGGWPKKQTRDQATYDYWLNTALMKHTLSPILNDVFAPLLETVVKRDIPVTIVDDDDISLQPNRCESCTYWGNCNTENDDRKPCSSHKVVYAVRADEWTSDMVEVDDPDGGMLTGPKFGCVHWEVNPKLYVMGD